MRRYKPSFKVSTAPGSRTRNASWTRCRAGSGTRASLPAEVTGSSVSPQSRLRVMPLRMRSRPMPPRHPAHRLPWKVGGLGEAAREDPLEREVVPGGVAVEEEAERLGDHPRGQRKPTRSPALRPPTLLPHHSQRPYDLDHLRSCLILYNLTIGTNSSCKLHLLSLSTL